MDERGCFEAWFSFLVWIWEAFFAIFGMDMGSLFAFLVWIWVAFLQILVWIWVAFLQFLGMAMGLSFEVMEAHLYPLF